MSISEKSIGQSIAALGFEFQRKVQEKTREGKRSGLAETDQQFQIDVSGNATPVTSWTEKEVVFDETIVAAVAQRDNPLPEPHFTYGSVLQSDPPVMLHATVRKWLKDPSGDYAGAVIALGVTCTEGPAKFKARVHVVFQGLSLPNYPATGEGEG